MHENALIHMSGVVCAAQMTRIIQTKLHSDQRSYRINLIVIDENL
jgi:hypothetical protein